MISLVVESCLCCNPNNVEFHNTFGRRMLKYAKVKFEISSKKRTGRSVLRKGLPKTVERAT
jgi:hypothetical protein